MYDIEYYKRIFDRYGGMMRTTQLAEEKVFYQQREKLIEDGKLCEQINAECIIHNAE